MFLLAAGAVLASRAGAQGSTSDGSQPQPPPSDRSQSWYQRDAAKAKELGQKGVDAGKRGASWAGKETNAGGQAATSKVVGTKTVSGEVADVSRDHVTVNRSDGSPMDLRVTGSTKVTVGGKKAQVGALEQGDQVRASYAQSGGAATATRIDVKGKGGSRSAGSQPGSTTR
jgi:hypothetical protein